jgi:hypothetical protein
LVEKNAQTTSLLISAHCLELKLMNSFIYPEDGIVEVTLEKKPNRNNAIYVYDLSFDGKDYTAEVTGHRPLTDEQKIDLFKRALGLSSALAPEV